CVAFLLPAFVHAQTTRLAGRDFSVRELSALLAQSIPTAEFQVRQTLKDALAGLDRAFRRQGFELPIVLDDVAFKEENPDAPDVYETSVKLPEFPRTLPAGRLLSILLSQIPTNNGSYRIMPGVIQITTLERTSMSALLSSPVHARFQQRPFYICLE